MSVTEPLSAPIELTFDYTRSLGTVLRAFMTGLAERRIVGVRASDGRVFVPPVEYDPVTATPLADVVDVADVGTVTSWTWVAVPVEGQPFDRPFAWALITLDGADTPLLHAVDVAGPAEIRTGLRVRARWATTPIGNINAIECFVPATDADVTTSPLPTRELVEMVTTPVHLHIEHSASIEETHYLQELAQGRVVGQRCPVCEKVYIPPRSACPTDGVPPGEYVELSDRGVVTTFCVVNVPFLGQRITPPYVAAYVLLDGADIAFLHLILGCEPAEVRMGMRVQASWRPRDQWGTTLQNIDHFRPTGEPDAPFQSYAEHL
ncbi:MAG: OB-fold domain-containing protein [Jatrophihabitantaceae bacterium]